MCENIITLDSLFLGILIGISVTVIIYGITIIITNGTRIKE
jgi:hypothetical protein